MPARLTFSLLTVLFGLGLIFATSVRSKSQVLPPAGVATFRFSTSVQTPKGKHFGGGTITVKHTHGSSLTVTVQSDDGKTKTIPLVVNTDGTVAPDPAAPAPAATDQPDAAARAFMADVTLAAHVGIAARKNVDLTSFDVPVTLTPVGDGTPVPAHLHMTGSQGAGGVARYAGSVGGNTLTKLPPGGGLDPAALAKTVGVGAIAHAAFGPAGRIATAVAMHHQKKEEKKAAGGLLADAIHLSVTTELANGKFRGIDGTQDDVVNIANKKVTIHSTWTFSKTSP